MDFKGTYLKNGALHLLGDVSNFQRFPASFISQQNLCKLPKQLKYS